MHQRTTCMVEEYCSTAQQLTSSALRSYIML